jgi:pimeloyl-ACP methyl ester carboxylesterase
MWLTGAALRVLEDSCPGVLYTDLKACDQYLDGLNNASAVSCPVLLLLGKEDMMTRPKGAQALVANLNDVHQIVLDGCGHMLMGECPDAVLDALIEFL